MWDKKVHHMKITGIYVAYCLIIGKKESAESLIDELKNHEFNLKVERNVNEYLSCCTEESKDTCEFFDSFDSKFGIEIKGKRKFLTPGMLRV
jgi:hypothetical protein